MVGKCYIIRVFVKCDDRRMPDVGQRARFGVFPKAPKKSLKVLILYSRFANNSQYVKYKRKIFIYYDFKDEGRKIPVHGAPSATLRKD